MTTEPTNEPETKESPFGEITLSASIPGLPFSQMHVTLKTGVDPFKAAARFREKFVETFGADAVAAALPQPPVAHAGAAVAPAGGTPKCNTHNKAMKQSNHGGWYCTAKLGDGSYCTEKVAA